MSQLTYLFQKMEKCLFKTNPVQEGRQHQELTKMSTKSNPLFVKTITEPLINFVRWSVMEINSENMHMKRVFFGAQATGFSSKTLHRLTPPPPCRSFWRYDTDCSKYYKYST